MPPLSGPPDDKGPSKLQHGDSMATNNACDGLTENMPSDNMDELIEISPIHTSERKLSYPVLLNEEELEIMDSFLANAALEVGPTRKGKTSVSSNLHRAAVPKPEQLGPQEIVEEGDDADFDEHDRWVEAELKKLHDNAVSLQGRLRVLKMNHKNDMIRSGIDLGHWKLQEEDEVAEPAIGTKEDAKMASCTFYKDAFHSFRVHSNQTSTLIDTMPTNSINATDLDTQDLDVEDLDLEGLDDEEAEEVIDRHLEGKVRLLQAKLAALASGFTALRSQDN
ncbi:hypothetical protein HDK77DRAFT_511171 [Phyllosticta capitalensis]